MQQTSPGPALAQPKRISGRARAGIFVVAWLIVLMPFLFWRSTWFGRPLNDADLTQYLHDTSKPRHIQQALVQISERLSRGDTNSVAQWYPDLVKLANSPVEEIRTTDAWLMGQAPTQPEFHAALLLMLHDRSVAARNNAALALVHYTDASGHEQIVAMLKPLSITAPAQGKIEQIANAGEPIRNGTVVARLWTRGMWERGGIRHTGEALRELRSPITGTVSDVRVKKNDLVEANAELAVISPGTDQVWEALRALYLIGTPDDLEIVKSYERPQPNLADRVQQQARETEAAIRARSNKQ